MKRTFGKLLFAGLLLTGHLAGQSSSYYSYTAEGTTPPGLAPGSPASSYALSGFDNVNPFSGKLNIALPLFTAKGRGDAGYTAMLRPGTEWGFSAWNCLEESGCGVRLSYTPQPDGWISPRAGFGPGMVIGRVSYTTAVCGTSILSEFSLTRFTFIEPDGTEHELRDTQFQGQELRVLDYPAYCNILCVVKTRSEAQQGCRRAEAPPASTATRRTPSPPAGEIDDRDRERRGRVSADLGSSGPMPLRTDRYSGEHCFEPPC